MKKLYWQITIDRLLKYGGEVRKTSIGDNQENGQYVEKIEIFFKDINLSILLIIDERKGSKGTRGLCFLIGGDCGTVRYLFKGRREAISYAKMNYEFCGGWHEAYEESNQIKGEDQ
jgi:hypothetical protein